MDDKAQKLSLICHFSHLSQEMWQKTFLLFSLEVLQRWISCLVCFPSGCGTPSMQVGMALTLLMQSIPGNFGSCKFLECLRHVYNVWVDKGSVARIDARRKRGKTDQISESLTWFQISLRRSRWQCLAIAVAHAGASWTIPQMRTFWMKKDEKAKLPLYGLSLGISSLMPWFCSFTLVTFSAVHWISRLQRKDRLGDGVWARSDTVYTVGRAVGNKHLLSSNLPTAMSPGKDSRKALRKRPLSLVPSWMKL